MPKVLKKPTITLQSFKNHDQVAIIDGVKHQFNFSECELVDSIINNTATYDLERRSGMNANDYNAFEMACVIAENCDEADVFTMIDQLPESELSDYAIEATSSREEHCHAA